MLSVAILGCGPRGLEHARAIRSVAGLALMALADLRPSARESAARQFGLPAVASLDELWSSGPPEILVLATPLAGRTALAHEALRRGGLKALVIEKPLAHRLDEALALVSACEAASVRLFVVHQLRYCPEFEALKEALDQGQLGEPSHVRAYCYGNILNQGPHLFDFVLWLAGARKLFRASATACDDSDFLERMGTGAWGYFKDHAHPAPMWMTHELEFEDGLRASLETGLRYRRSDFFVDDWLQKRVAVDGSAGSAEAQTAGFFRIKKADVADWTSTPGSLDTYLAATKRFHEAVVAALERGAPHRNEGRESLRGLEALLACAHGAATGQPVAPPLEPATDPWTALAKVNANKPAVVTAVDEVWPACSIIVPILDHRGLLPKCIEGWNNQVRVRAPEHEVIYLSNGRHPDQERLVEAMKRAGDRLMVDRSAANEHVLYNLGAREAKGPLLLITEPHVWPEPACVEELARFFARTSFDGACMRDLPWSANAMARMEERMYGEYFPIWSAPGDWRKVILRAFAIKKDVFQALGGFRLEYLKFSEWFMAADLHRHGYRLGYASGPALWHAYPVTVSQFSQHLYDFTWGECVARLNESAEFMQRYFGAPPAWEQRESCRAANARRDAGLLLSAYIGGRGAQGPRGGLGQLIRAKARLLPALLATVSAGLWGPYGSRWKEFWRYQINLALMKVSRPFSEAWMYPCYLRMYFAICDHARWKFICGMPAPQEQPVPIQQLIELAHWPEEFLSGLHAPERHAEGAFRWTMPLARVRFNVPAGDYEATLQLLPVRRPRLLRIFCNGRGLDKVRVKGWTGVTFCVPKEVFVPGAQELELVCDPLPRAEAPKDPRLLGLPLRSLCFNPVKA